MEYQYNRWSRIQAN